MPESVLTQHAPVASYRAKQSAALTEMAHQKAWQLLEEIGAALQPGVSETEAKTLAQAAAQRLGIEKNWHQPKIYFGPHTILTAYEPSPPENLILQEHDIAFIDIGPVISLDGLAIEGDVGRTLVFGQNPLFHQLKAASEEIFKKGSQFWQEHQPTGIALYQYIEQLIQQAGFVPNLQRAGHLIGAFPHSGWREGLNHYSYLPEAGLWILEIQMRHPTQPYGAFYEAVLQ
jgi:Xaa-Pro aminopeptidase